MNYTLPLPSLLPIAVYDLPPPPSSQPSMRVIRWNAYPWTARRKSLPDFVPRVISIHASPIKGLPEPHPRDESGPHTPDRGHIHW